MAETLILHRDDDTVFSVRLADGINVGAILLAGPASAPHWQWSITVWPAPVPATALRGSGEPTLEAAMRAFRTAFDAAGLDLPAWREHCATVRGYAEAWEASRTPQK